ncbi:lysoplasmalogenase family protein [Galactobacter valiniphilus]|uniref:lysoplasmalogenase family protein n=1 Tax=Galactobacter valiniphilus TaxID=2676122 RepID=UPI003735906F
MPSPSAGPAPSGQHPTARVSVPPTGTDRPSAPRDTLAASAWFLYAAAVLVHVLALAVDNATLAGPTKLTLMPLLAVAAWLGVRHRLGGPGRVTFALLLAAVALSWLGDGAATFTPFLPTLPAMLGFFGLAHVAYIVVFWRRLAVRPLGWAVAWLPVWWIGMVLTVAPHAGGLAVAVAAYGIVLACTCAASWRGPFPAWWGGIAFLVSDSILAFRLFLPDMPHWTSPAVMLTYGVGQGLLVWAACRGLSSPGRGGE